MRAEEGDESIDELADEAARQRRYSTSPPTPARKFRKRRRAPVSSTTERQCRASHQAPIVRHLSCSIVGQADWAGIIDKMSLTIPTLTRRAFPAVLAATSAVNPAGAVAVPAGSPAER